MDLTELINAFYDLAEEEESTASLENIRNLALEKISGGEGKSLIASTVNGKSFSFNVNLPASDLFSAASRAIRRYNKGVVVSTEPDFSQL